MSGSRESLKTQCLRLGIPLEHLRVVSLAQPERVAIDGFRQEGFDGAICEGGLFLLLKKSMTLDLLVKYNTFGSRSDACTRFLEAQFTIHSHRVSEFLNTAAALSTKQMLKNFQEIYEYTFVRDCYPEVKPAMLGALLNAAGRDRILLVMKRFAQSPYDYRSGWPDLTVFRGSELRLIEVRTSDKLHSSQIRWFENIGPIFSAGTCSVLRLMVR